MNNWIQVTSMGSRRIGLAAATGSDGLIYAIGGVDSIGNALNVLEAYDPEQNTWSSKPAAMPTPRAELAVVTGKNGAIYAIGGSDNTGHSLTTVEVYDTSSWKAVKPLSVPRSQLAAVTATDGRIYAIGGTNNKTSLNTVEIYDPNTDSWTSVPSMAVSRSRLAAATGSDLDGLFPDGCIYAIDGQDFSFAVSYNTVEAYTIPCLSLISQVQGLEFEIQSLEHGFQMIDKVPVAERERVRRELEAEWDKQEKALESAQEKLKQCKEAN